MPVSSRSSAAGKLPLAAALSPTLQLLYTGLAPVSAAVPWVFSKQTKIAHSPLPETTGLCTFRMQRPSFIFRRFSKPLFLSPSFQFPSCGPRILVFSFVLSTWGYLSSPSLWAFFFRLPLRAVFSASLRAAFSAPPFGPSSLPPLQGSLSGPLAVTSWPSSRPGSDLWMPSRGTEYG